MKTVVHLGSGYSIPGHREGPVLQPHTNYFCVDPCQDWFGATGKCYYKALPDKIKKHVKLIFRDGRNTPFSSESIDEVHMYNVLSYREVKDKQGLLDEAMRILKDSGSFFVGELITPEEHPLSVLRNRMSDYDQELLFLNGSPSPLSVDEVIDMTGGMTVPTRLDKLAYIVRFCKRVS